MNTIKENGKMLLQSAQWNKQLWVGIRQGLGYLIIGMGVNMISQSITRVWNNLRNLVCVTVTVDSKDKAFEALLCWLSEHSSVKRANSLSAETVYHSSGKNPHVIFVPSVGKHKVQYKGVTIWVERIRDPTFDMSSGAPFESLHLIVWSYNKEVALELVREALQQSLQRDEGKTIVYIASNDGSWVRFGNPRTARQLSSVILPPGVTEKLADDVREFLNSESWFRNRGVPYRRGYLLHGPPGNGKSSLVNALAGELELDICVVSLSARDMDDQKLNNLLNSAPPKSLLLIEDIDAAFVARDSTGTTGDHLTFSGLLNALDGVASQEGRILFMTTNRVDQLDNALIRDGRIDLKVHVSNATSEQARRLFCHFYNLDSTLEQPMADQFANHIVDHRLSMSQLQGFLLQYKKSPEKAVKNINNLNQ